MKAVVIALLLAAVLVWRPAAAAEDHERVRRAVEAGQILPLKDILAKAESAYLGQIIEAELESKDGTMVYEIKLLTTDGRVMKLLYDARTGELLKAKGRERR